MVLNNYCIIGYSLLVAQIYLTLSFSNTADLKKNLIDILDEKQRETYFTIVNERSHIYIQGLVLGLLLGFGYLVVSKGNGGLFNSLSLNVCTFITIVFVTNVIYYLLKPKSSYMINHLNNPAQIEAWSKIYRGMQFKYISGILMGIISYGLISYGVLK